MSEEQAIVTLVAAIVAAILSGLSLFYTHRNWSKEREYKTRFHFADLKVKSAMELGENLAKLSTHHLLMIRARRKGGDYQDIFEAQYLTNLIVINLDLSKPQDKKLWGAITDVTESMAQVRPNLTDEEWSTISTDLLNKQHLVTQFANLHTTMLIRAAEVTASETSI